MSLISSKPTDKKRLQQLERLVPLNTLSDDELVGLAEHVEFKKLKAGEYLFREGDTAPLNAYLLSGKVVLLLQGHEESRVTAGSIVSKFPLAHQIPRKFSVRALNDVEVALVDRKLLDESLGQADSVDYEVDELSRLGSQDWMEKLLETPSFQGVSPDNVPKVLVNVEEMLVFSGDELISQGKNHEFFYMIHEGRAIVTKQAEDGRGTVELEQLVPGDTFGGDILLSAGPSNVTVSMATNGILLRLGKDVFTQLVFMPLIREIVYIDAVASVNQGAQWVDVRSQEAFMTGHVPNSVNIPFDAVREHAPNLKADQPCIVYGGAGREILSAAFSLIEEGYEVLLLKDGLKAVPANTLSRSEQTVEPVVAGQPQQIIEKNDVNTVADDQSELAQLRLDKTKEQLAAQTTALEKLKEQHHTASELWSRERGMLKDSAAKNKAQLENLNQQIESDRALIQQLYQDKDAAVASMEKANEELEQLRRRITELETEKEIDEQGFSGATEELDRKQAELDKANEQLKRMQAERDDARVQLDERIGQLHQSQADIDKATAEREKLAQRLDEHTAEHEKILRQEQQSAQEQRLAFERELLSVKEEMEAAKQSKAETDAKELNDLKATLVEMEQRNSRLSDEKENLQQQLQAVKQEVEESANVELAAMKATLVEVEHQNSTLKLENEELQQKQGNLKTVSRDEESAVSEESASTELEALRIELDVARTQAAMEKEELQKSLNDLKASLQIDENLDTQVNLQELDKLRLQSVGLEKQVEETNAHCQELEDSLEDRNEQIQQLENKVVEEQLRRRELQVKIDALEQQPSDASSPLDDVDERVKLYQPVDSRTSTRSFLTGTLAGMLLLFVSVEIIALVSGKGELFTTLIADRIQQQLTVPVERDQMEPPPATRAEAVDDVEKEEPPLREEKRPSLTGTLLGDVTEGPAMIRIDGAEFVMGSDISGLPDNEKPAHQVTLQTFAVSRTEVTFEDYDDFARSTGRPLPDDNGWGRGQRPVINISWRDAVDYTLWLSERTGHKYRLPTEAEWEFVAQGGSETTYWWGYSLGNGDANCFECGSQWDRKSTAPVASFKANGFGLHNTAGNVREWVQDCYHDSYQGAPTDGSAWEQAGCAERVVRGGSYDKLGKTMMSTSRSHLGEKTKVQNVGFRVARDL